VASEFDRCPFSVAATAHDGQMLVTVRGDLDVLTAPELETAIAASLRMHPYTLVIDFSEVTFMDSSACRTLLQARGDAIKSAVELELCGITDSCRRTLQVLDLDKLFTFTTGNDDGS
jgi:anti-sigma B factor antagonist